LAQVFISYSRRDKEFVRRLGEALAAQQRKAWIDWKDIPLTAEWQKEIFANIEAADSFVFVISPDSVASANCKKEIEHASANNKRMVPVFFRPVSDEAIPEALARVQRLDFEDGEAFDTNFASKLWIPTWLGRRPTLACCHARKNGNGRKKTIASSCVAKT